MNKYKYIINKSIYKFLKKDSMILDIEYYRSKGASIGDNMRTFSPLISSEPYLLEFKNNITISSDVVFITHDNTGDKTFDSPMLLCGKISIGSNCFIGQRTIILPGVTLANNTIVGAGSVVTKSVLEEGKIIGGNPAKIIGNISDFKQKYMKNAFRVVDISKKKELIFENIDKLMQK